MYSVSIASHLANFLDKCSLSVFHRTLQSYLKTFHNGCVIHLKTTSNECFNSTKQTKNSTKWNKVVHRVNEKTNESDWRWKQEKTKKKNARSYLQMMKNEWQMMNDEYEVNCMITTITIQYFNWLFNASIYLSTSFVNPHSCILVIYYLQPILLLESSLFNLV